MKRTTLIAILAIFGIIALSTLTFAGPMRGKGMRGDCPGWNQNPAVQQLTQEKQDQLKSILDEHRKEMTPMHNAMREKRTLLKALSANSNTKPEAITALVGESSDLRAQAQTKREALQSRVSKEIGIDLPMGFGMHDRRGMGGRGHGDFGQRGMRQGMGQGMGQGMNPEMDAAPGAPDA